MSTSSSASFHDEVEEQKDKIIQEQDNEIEQDNAIEESFF